LSPPDDPWNRRPEWWKVLSEIRLRLLISLGIVAGVIGGFAFDGEKSLGKAYLIWGSLLLLFYASLQLHPRLRTIWLPRFEAFGIVLVGLGTILVTGLPHGVWAVLTTGGALGLVVLLHLVLASN
jgi:hypothetical protein